MSRGASLGRYTLIEQLAVGGMAEIWLAHMAGPEGFEKLLVIKKILPHLSQRTSFLNMFLNEARLAAQLNHPNIVQLYDLAKVDETYFIAMEYVFGRDLSEIGYKAKQKQVSVPIDYATKIISQVCEGLYYAHTKNDQFSKPLNIVHRDVSPHNVLVSFAGNVKILDFGIAKAANQYDQTQQGILKGKVSYMSPEQIWGDPIDARSDLFGLGAVFYELVTGSRLFTGDNDMAILRKITEDDIKPPSHFNPDIPPDLEAIILRTLDKNPETRYPNAWELQQDLNLLLKRLGNPSNIHMAQFLKELFVDEMDAERRYLQKKIEELVHAEVLPPIEEEETLVVFAGSHPLGQMEQDISQVLELASEDEVSTELPLVMGTPMSQDAVSSMSAYDLPLIHDAGAEENTSQERPHNQWLDPHDSQDDALDNKALSSPTSEVHRPSRQSYADMNMLSEETNPEFAVREQLSHVEQGNAVRQESQSGLHHPSPTPEPVMESDPPTSVTRSLHTKPSAPSHTSSPLFETIQQLQDHLPQSLMGAHLSATSSLSHAEAHRNASYVGPKKGLSGYSSTPPVPVPAPIPMSRVTEDVPEETFDSIQEEETFDTPSEETFDSVVEEGVESIVESTVASVVPSSPSSHSL